MVISPFLDRNPKGESLMEFSEFLSRRSSALAVGETGNFVEAEKALRALLEDSQFQSPEGLDWVAIVNSDIAVTLAKQGNRKMAEEFLQKAYRAARASHPFVELMVTHNRSVMYDALGDTDESVEWAWQTSEITRMHESVLPQLGGRTSLDGLFFELGALALHVVIDYYTQVKQNFERAQNFAPEALRWINRAIETEDRSSEKGRDLIRKQARLLSLLGSIKMQLGQKKEARDDFFEASELYSEAGNLEDSKDAARLASLTGQTTVKRSPTLTLTHKAKRKFDSPIQEHRPPIKEPMMFKLLESQFSQCWVGIFNAMKSGKNFDKKDAETALEVAEKLVEMEPLRGSPWLYKSWILSALGRFDESLEANRQAIEIDPSDPEKWAFRASMLQLVGRTSEADKAAARAKMLREQ
jgi:tetratricopeptide (TPR) repeat protein